MPVKEPATHRKLKVVEREASPAGLEASEGIAIPAVLETTAPEAEAAEVAPPAEVREPLMSRPKPREVPTISGAMDSFKATLSGKSPRTVTTYATGLRRMAQFLESRKLKIATDPSTALPDTLLEDFYLWLVDIHGRDARMTISTYVAAISAFVRYLDRRRWLPEEASYSRMREEVRALMGRSSYKTPRIDSRIPLIVMAAENCTVPIEGSDYSSRQKRLEVLRDRAVLHVLFSTGLRREEVSRLNRADIEDGRRSQAIITGKGDKERVVFFGPDALKHIRAYIIARADNYQPLFTRHDRGRGKPARGGTNYRLSAQSVWGIVKQWALVAGIEATTHDFRHAKASTLLNRGAQLSEVQDLLGHASPETTKKIYAHYTTSHLREAFDRFSVSPQEAANALEHKTGDLTRPDVNSEPTGQPPTTSPGDRDEPTGNHA